MAKAKTTPRPPAKAAPQRTSVREIAKRNPSSPKDARLDLPRGTPMVWR
jgi:hypothetical protein